MRKLSFAAAVLVATVAAAYVLPGYSILRRLADARDDLKLAQLKVDGALSFHGASAKEAAAATAQTLDRPELSLDGALYLRLPLRCRLEARVADTAKAAAVSNAGKERVEGTEVAALSMANEQLCALLAGRSQGEGDLRAKLDVHLKSLGVDTQVTSLARFGGDVAYVLGAKEEGKSQFWVYKNEFQPARLRFTDKAGAVWDLRLYDYASPATGEWFPRTVELFKGAELQLRFTALDGDGKTALAEKLF